MANSLSMEFQGFTIRTTTGINGFGFPSVYHVVENVTDEHGGPVESSDLNDLIEWIRKQS